MVDTTTIAMTTTTTIVITTIIVSLRVSLTSSFVHYIQSNKESENGLPVVYCWSNKGSQDDAEIVGPFKEDKEVIEAALGKQTAPEPIERGEINLELVRLKIVDGIFIKVLKSIPSEESPNEDQNYYAVIFLVKEAEECGQKMLNFFLTERECKSDANKHNSFKQSLLNKCQDKFNKQDIYNEWKKERSAFLQVKKRKTVFEQKEKTEELEF